MNAIAPYHRLLWKELRVLRNVWLMCGIGVTFLMLLILTIGESTDNSRGYSAAFWIFMVWIPPVYVLAALATMFAGEREEGTLVWLTTLSPRLSSVISSRLFFVVATGIGLQAWYGLSALLLSQFDEPIGTSPTDSEENLIIMSFLLVEALAYGMFWSLQTNRPLNAILYAAISIILVNTGAAMLTEAMGGRIQVRSNDALGYALGFWGWARCLLVVATMVANWKLAGQWLDGRPWDWEWVAAWWSRRRTKTAVGTTTVAVMPADATEPWRRAWQRLCWLEWQGIRSFAWIVLGLTLLSCASTHLWLNGRPTFGFTFAIGWLVIILGGLMSWHGEQSQQRFRALVRLGISPLALWFNKLACWFAATVLAVAMIAGSTALWWSVISFFGRPATHGYHAPLRELWAEAMANPHAETVFTWALNYCLMLFVMGFACSQLLRKTVLSLGVALMGAVTFSAWFALCGQFLLPWPVFLAPIPVWMLWISASALPYWWTEQTTWRVPYRRMGALALQSIFPIVLLALAAGYRVWEVPTIPAVADPTTVGYRVWEVPSVSAVADPITVNVELIANSAAAEQNWKQLWEWVHRPLVIPSEITIPENRQELFYRQPMFLIQFGTNEAASRRALVAANRETIDEITWRISAAAALTNRRPSTDDDNWNHLYAPLTLYAAQQALEDEDVEKSLRYLHAAARMSGMIRRLTPPSQTSAGAPSIFRQEMIRWAQHPKQTESTLRQGLTACAGDLQFWQAQPEELYFTRQEELRETMTVYWPWERARARKLVDVAYSNRLQYLKMCRSAHIQPGVTEVLRSNQAARFHMSVGDPRMAAWKFLPSETYGRYFDGQQLVHGLEPGEIDSLFVGENQYHATLALMAVVGYRRLHGALPGSLLDVESYFEIPATPNTIASSLAPAMNDVWTGLSFGYAPQGFPLKEPAFPPMSGYRQPLLWTSESRHYRVDIRGNQIQRYSQSHGFWSNASIRDDHSGDDKSWLFPIPPQEPMEPAAKPE